LDEEKWIAAGNERRSHGTSGRTAVEAVRSAIEQEPGGEIGQDGLTGLIDLRFTGTLALPPQLFMQKKLKELNLYYNPQLSGALPLAIGALTELTWLNLSETAVTSLSVEAAKLTRLERLYWRVSKAPAATVRIPAAVFTSLPLECIMWFWGTCVEITARAPDEFDVFLPRVLMRKGEDLKNGDVQVFLRDGAAMALARKTAARVAAEELLDARTWIKAGNAPGVMGSAGAIEKVCKAINEEPDADIGPDGFTGTLSLRNTGWGIRALPPQIFAQTKLKVLNLYYNPQLSGALPPEIGALTEMRILTLSFTALSSLPVEAAKLTKLEGLYWHNSRAPGAAVRIPTAVFAALPSECTMSFEDTLVEVTAGAPGGFDVFLPRALTRKGDGLKNGDVLDFLSNGAAMALARKTAARVTAEELLDEETWIEAGNVRGAQGVRCRSAVEAIRKAIEAEPSGDVGPDGFTGTLYLCATGLRALPPQIFTQTQLEGLWLSGNPELSGGNLSGDAGALALAKGLPSCPSLQTLDFSHNDIGRVGAAALAEAMQACPSLEELLLEGNVIGDTATVLAEALRGHPSLKKLDLGGCKIGHLSAAALAEVMGTCPSFRKLYLSNNKIGDAGVIALDEGMQGHPNLQLLHLAKCIIGDTGALVLAEVMGTCPSLRKLYLSGNKIGEAGATALARGMRACLSLVEIHLSENKFGGAGEVALMDAARACPSLLDFWFTPSSLAKEAERNSILNAHERTRLQSRSATRCLLWCYEQLQCNPPLGNTASLRSVPHVLVLQIAALVRVPVAHPPSNAVQVAEAAREAQIELRSGGKNCND
jgi:Leucine-rich repeat (LRR) protein